ncbi:uncharacterized protein Traf-like [Periplaneta americana]|uniref:uncharacterized protein Traf-like n=1 Tax=Periplaneta americana TaxID=6978 RepID=UPI0037E904F7
MAELRSTADHNIPNSGNVQQQQGTRKPHRPGRTITCYYCGLVLHEKHLQAHMQQCHLVLEGCPNKCGVTVERHEMQHHLDNECMNKRWPTSGTQTTAVQQPTTNIPPTPNIHQPTTNLPPIPNIQQPTTNIPPTPNIQQLTTNFPPTPNIPQNVDLTSILQQRESQHISQVNGMPEEWNDKVIAALMVIKKALLKEENERCRAEAEWKLELKKLNQRVQVAENTTHNTTAPQVNTAQFHELREEVLLLKEALIEERHQRHSIEQQLAYEAEKSSIWYQQLDDLKIAVQTQNDTFETWKMRHEEEINRLLQEVVQERQLRIRAETELKMEAAKLEDLCCTLEQWRDEEKNKHSNLEAQHRDREIGWKGQIEKQQGEFDNLREVVAKCRDEVDEFREFLSSENIMISGLWAEQLAEVRSINEKIQSLNETSEAKTKKIAQLKQRVNECDEAITKQVRGSSILSFGHIVWKISDFETKMADAKENNTILHSPVFYSSQHGYKLRVEVRLNGLGQWTGRHMTASLQVLEGEWDALLQWPFNQRVTLTLRDQSKAPDKVNNLVKNLVEGREKEDPAGLHVFIPHTALQQHNYVVNNVMFLEVTVA